MNSKLHFTNHITKNNPYIGIIEITINTPIKLIWTLVHYNKIYYKNTD